MKDILSAIQNMIRAFRSQDFYHGNLALSSVTEQLTALANMDPGLSQDASFINTLSNMLKAKECEDYIALCDCAEESLFPLIASRINGSLSPSYLEANLTLLDDPPVLADQIRTRAADVRDDTLGCYRIEASATGYPILRNGSLRYHSVLNPISEASMLADFYVTDDTLHYVLFDFALGYLSQEILKKDERLTLTALASDLDALTLAFIYCDLAPLFSNKRFQLHYAPIDQLPEFLSNEDASSVIFHYPSLLELRENPCYDALHRIFLISNSYHANKKLMRANFFFNVKRQSPSADNVINALADKTILYLGGGPSLAHHIDYIKACCKDSSYVITCASTLYRQLTALSVRIDYVFLSDANHLLQKHFDGVPATGAILIHSSTASFRAVNAFCGDSCIAFQEGYPPANSYALEHGLTRFSTGSTVSALAIDLILRSNAACLLCFGLDLAFSDGDKRHAFDADTSAALSSSSHRVPAIGGGTIPSSEPLIAYRLWIEGRIRGESRPLYNISNGAVIQGMDNRLEPPGIS